LDLSAQQDPTTQRHFLTRKQKLGLPAKRDPISLGLAAQPNPTCSAETTYAIGCGSAAKLNSIGSGSIARLKIVFWLRNQTQAFGLAVEAKSKNIVIFKKNILR
jgi:hypothetical protein